jgi:hypothetical protein
MEIIKIQDFVSNHDYANYKVTNFDNNKLVIKGDTGIGGTSAILNITDKNIIIVSPLSGMIAGKEKVREPHQMFIYQHSRDRWFNYENDLKAGYNIILNTTPEQIIELKKTNKELYDKVMETPFFIDEAQVYSESDYRPSMSVFYNILFNEHRGNYTLSTATPTYKNLDIPKHILEKMEIIKIEPEIKRVKNITITKRDNYWEFIKSNCQKGIKVVLFSNDLNKIKNVINEENLHYKTQLLVGKTLAVKTSGIKSKTYSEYDKLLKSTIDKDVDIYILSTKYLIGFDLKFDASIGIIMDESSIVDGFNINQVVQAYGRVRNHVIDAKIFYQSTNTDIMDLKVMEIDIEKIPFDSNYLSNIQPIINSINYSLSYPKSNLIKSLEEYGFNVAEDENKTDLMTTTKYFPDIYKTLITQENQDPFILQKELVTIYNKIKGDDPNLNGYTMKELLLWATAYLAVETNSDYLLNANAERYERLLITAKTFIDVNDLAYPEQMNDMDKITKFRVSEHAMNIAIKAGAVCEARFNGVTSDNTASIFLNEKLVAKYGEYSTTYSSLSNSSTDNPFSRAKQIINTLYTIYLVEKDMYDGETKRIINGFKIVSECVIEDYIIALSINSNQEVQAVKDLLKDDDKEALKYLTEKYANGLKGHGIFDETNEKILLKLSELKGYEEYTQSEINQMMSKADNIKSSLLMCKQGIRNSIKLNTYSIKLQKERHKNYVLSLLSLKCAGHMFGFKTTSIDNRVFNPATKTSRQLRRYTPYELIECDIKSAFASFLDTIVESNISQQVYKNLMKKYTIGRDSAKTQYNMMLNDYNRNILEAKKFFRDCGYTEEQVTEIVKLTSKEKGSFYRKMTIMEDNLIDKFKHINRLDHTAVRLHDAVIMYNTPDNQNLTTEIDNYKFELKKL